MNAPSAQRCWAEIDLEAVRHNARLMHQRAGPRTELLAVIKANAYGHGAAEIARALATEAQLFGVANLEEALEVRRSVATTPILLLGPALPDERSAIVSYGFIASVSSYEEAAAFAALGRDAPAQLNLEVDTGMGRMGCDESRAVETCRRILSLRGAKLHSVSTHLPVADEDPQFTRDEIERFATVVAEMRKAAPGDYKAHALLSAGVLGFADERFEVSRVGLALYGASPLADHQHLLRPAMTLKARVVLVRHISAGTSVSYGRTFTASKAMRVATLGAGYADGYPRSLSNSGASVLIQGKRCPLLGRVTMDMIVVDVSELGAVEPGAEAVLIGRQGSEEILATEIALRAGTIAWEVFTGIGTRVRRVYTGAR